MVSSKTPDSIQQKIERDVMHAMASELVRQRFAALGFVPVGSRASEFAEILRSNMQRIRALIDELGISAD
jgi:tripartite-type tricarboxylate transporter receptor subunit TctC